jgi:iron complex transport system permease protein
LTVDTVSRSAFATEIPLGILTSLIGIPIFIAVLRHSVRR